MKLFWARLMDFIKGVIKFFTVDLWVLDFSELSKFKQKLAKHLQAIVMCTRNYFKNRIGREAVALSFFSTMAAVPMVAVVLFISSGFGLAEMLDTMLRTSFPDSNKLIDVIVKVANNMIGATENGLFGWISFLTFVWLVFWLMIQVGVAFNRVGRVRKPRKLWRKVVVYMTILIMIPFVLILFLSGLGYYLRFLGILNDQLGSFSFLTTNMFWLVFYGIAALILSLMYKFIPSEKVRYGAALRSAFIVGIVFVGIQYLYMGTQLMVTRLSAVYGVLAFIPLFMVWINLCWQTILYGASLTFAFDELDKLDEAERNLRAYEEKEKELEMLKAKQINAK